MKVNGVGPNSAARLSVKGTSWWIPWPVENSQERETTHLLLINGREYVFPVIRLYLRGRNLWRFYTLDDWLLAAFTEWLFPLAAASDVTPNSAEKKNGQASDRFPAVTFTARMKPIPSDEVKLRLVGNLVNYALSGTIRNVLKSYIWSQLQLGVPDRPVVWYRDLAESYLHDPTDFQSSVNRSRVITAEITLEEEVIKPGIDGKRGTSAEEELRDRLCQGYGIPNVIGKVTSRYCLPCPDNANGNSVTGEDHGLDVYHTGEGDNLRLNLFLGEGVTVQGHQLVTPPAGNPACLSRSTIRIPFAGFNDPRRVLLGAKSQVQATPLKQSELPLVQTEVRDGKPGFDPPGLNLRVGYLAWAGWNHEDAWVISGHAADRFRIEETFTRLIAIRTAEIDPQILLFPGETASPDSNGKTLLIRRRASPTHLFSAFGNLGNWLDHLAEDRDFDQLADQLQENCCSLEPAEEDYLTRDGQVTEIEEWNLFEPRCRIMRTPGRWDDMGTLTSEIAKGWNGLYRKIYCFRLKYERPLQIGDKLANRHGHKGVVGLILDQNQMPCWNGEPLEALIDPISVINRANWGQIYETLAGALAVKSGGPLAADPHINWQREFCQEYPEVSCGEQGGQSWITPPLDRRWLKGGEVSAIAGIQFVMRLPKFAELEIRTDLETSPLESAPNESGQARFNQLTRFALWAHELGPHEHGRQVELSPETKEFQRMLRLAGYRLELKSAEGEAGNPGHHAGQVSISRLDLAGDPPHDLERYPIAAEDLPELQDDHYIKFRSPLEMSDDQSAPTQFSIRFGHTIAWVPVTNLDHLPNWGAVEHPLKTAQEEMLKTFRPKRKSHIQGGEKTDSKQDQKKNASQIKREILEKKRRVVKEFLFEARRYVLGTSDLNGKHSLIHQALLSENRRGSGRAVAIPAGLPLWNRGSDPKGSTLKDVISNGALTIDEIGLPPQIAEAINRGPQKNADKSDIVWLSRDPVLHRWGLLPVRFRVIKDSAIQIPASLLDIMGGDFDGDAFSVFRLLPHDGSYAEIKSRVPSAISRHPYSSECVFAPTKQYVYGLHLLSQDEESLQRFQADLTRSGAPPWPVAPGLAVTTVLKEWLRSVSGQANPQPEWWMLMEKHALESLAEDPGMGLRIIQSPAQIHDFDAVKSGAANGVLYAGERGTPSHRMIQEILAGDSLRLRQAHGIDPIFEIMVKAAPLKGLFGNLIKHLVYTAPNITSEFVQAAQVLTERMQQRVLSVKTVGGELPDYDNFRKHVIETLRRGGYPQESTPPYEWGRATEELIEEFRETLLFDHLLKVLRESSNPQNEKVLASVAFLRTPWDITDHLESCRGEIELPVDDLRIRHWFESSETGNARNNPTLSRLLDSTPTSE